MARNSDAITRRLYARGLWTLESPAHFGGKENGTADMCLLRDSQERLFIPAGSIVGAGRSYLARKCLSWDKYNQGGNKEPAELKQLFGGAEKDEDMSALFVADASCQQGKTQVRDGVRIDAASGTADDGAKFDVEVVEPGAAFMLKLECVIRCDDDPEKMKRLFSALLHGFQEGAIRLGARTQRGYGRGKVPDWDVRELEMTCAADVVAWLRRDVWSHPAGSFRVEPLLVDRRSFFHIEARFALETSLLIRSPSEEGDEEGEKAPDFAHLQSGGKPITPGTSWGGVLRQRAALIARTIGWNGCEVKKVIEGMFGPVHEPARRAGKGLWASRVQVEEHIVRNVKSRKQQRVAIDRFTGGSLESALFSEEPVFPRAGDDPSQAGDDHIQTGDDYTADDHHLTLELTLEEPDDAEIGLLLLVLRDLWNGEAALGGETSNGRGTLSGLSAVFTLRRNECEKNWNWSKETGASGVESSDGESLDTFVKKAKEAPKEIPGSREPLQRR